MRKHRLAERLLLDVIGLDFDLVHDEACRWEHVMSEEVERRIVALLGEALDSPFGLPIPGLAELGGSGEVESFREGLSTLSEVAQPEPRTVIVRRIGEQVQVDHEALMLLIDAGVTLRSPVLVHAAEGRIIVVGADRPAESGVSLPRDIADHVFVALD